MNELREIKGVIEGLFAGAHWKLIGALAAGVFHFVFGAELTPLGVLGGLMLLDLVTGIWVAGAAGEISSKGCRRGALKFVVYLILMSAAALADKVIPVRVAFSSMTAYLALTELISIMENVSKLGGPVPPVLLKTLKVMREKRAEAQAGS
jgi:toxin secretion/phage lysis holin